MDFAEKMVQNSRNSTGKVRKLEKNSAKRGWKWPKLEKHAGMTGRRKSLQAKLQ